MWPVVADVADVGGDDAAVVDEAAGRGAAGSVRNVAGAGAGACAAPAHTVRPARAGRIQRCFMGRQCSAAVRSFRADLSRISDT